MPRPKNKQELITASNDKFAKVWQTIDGLTERQFNSEFDFSNHPKLSEVR